MATVSDIVGKQKNASPTAQGSSMEKNTPKVGSAPSKSNNEQPVTRGQMFTLKSVGWKTKSPAGY